MIYPNKQALPPSMKSLPENKFTKIVASRESIDLSVQRRIEQENFNCNVVLFGIGALILSLIYFVLYWL